MSHNWKFKQLTDNEIKLGQLNREINNLIVRYSDPMNIEADATLITDYIWLGNWRAAHNSSFITEEKIKYIINATTDVPNKFPFVTCTTFAINDERACYKNLLPMMNNGADIINKAVQEKQQILVHCKRGHHRSASIVAFYLMKYRNMSLAKAIIFIKSVRPTAFSRMTCMLETLIQFSAH